MSAHPRRRVVRRLTHVAGAATLGLVLAACGGSSSPSSVSSTTGAGDASTTSFDAVSGKVIAASASSAAVQETSGPQTVDYGTDTRFTSTSSTSRSSLATGDCVAVTSADSGGADRVRPTPGATPSFPTKVTARSITVTSTSGCQQPTEAAGGFPRGNFTPPAGGFGESGTPRPFPSASGFPRGRFGGSGTFRTGIGGAFGGAFGTITAVNGSTIVVKSSFGSDNVTTVTTTSSTTYQATSTGSAADVKPGTCVNAIGSDDISGVLQARSVSISQPVNGECPAGSTFGGRGFGGPGFLTSGGAPGGTGGA